MRFFKKTAVSLLLAMTTAVPTVTFAEPTSGYGKVMLLRPYGTNSVFVTLDAYLCNTNVFTIDVTTAGGKAMYAAALTGLTTQLPVAIEMAPGPCVWAMPAQSLYLSR